MDLFSKMLVLFLENINTRCVLKIYYVYLVKRWIKKKVYNRRLLG